MRPPKPFIALPLLAALALLGPPRAWPQMPLPALLWPDGTLADDWRFVGLPGRSKPSTRFEAGRIDGVAGVRVSTDASYGNWVHDWSGPPPARLSWQWRLDQPLQGGRQPPDLRTKAGDDAALKVCLAFDHPLDRVPLWERTTLRMARSLSGEPLPAATLCYLWDSSQAAGTEGANIFTRRMRYVVLQGRDAPLARWLHESRDVGRDFARLFADELPEGADTPRERLPAVRAVLVGADSDNTGARSTGWIGALAVAP